MGARHSQGRPRWGEGSPSPVARGWLEEWRRQARLADATEALEHVFALAPARFLRRIPGRESFALSLGSGARIVVKRYRGEVAAEWWHRRLHRLPARSQARRECENLLELERLGLPVPRALMWIEEPGACSLGWRRRGQGRSALAMEHVEHRENLRERAAGARGHRELALELARLVARLHGAGWCHRDLYLQHVALGPEGLVLLDVARARHGEPLRRRWFVKDLAQLHCSTPASVSPFSRLRFFAVYARVIGLVPAGAERAWLAAIEAKARRLASHRPRHRDPASDPLPEGALRAEARR